LVFNSDCNKKIKVDGSSCSISNGVLEIELAAGTHTITKADLINLFYMSVANK
jgi:pectate lyase